MLTINLIEEDDTGLCLPSFFEQQSKLSLSLADPLAQRIRTLSHVEGHLTTLRADTVCQSSSQERLSCTGRPMEQYAPRRHDVETLENLGI